MSRQEQKVGFMTEAARKHSELSLLEQMRKLNRNAERIQSAPLHEYNERLAHKLLWMRPSVNAISAVSCSDETPQLGFSNISLVGIEKILDKPLSPPKRETPEKKLQSWLIRQALRANGRLKVLDDVLGGQFWFVSDEIALKTATDKLVADLLLVHVNAEGSASLVNAELKSVRSMETFSQLLSFRAAIEDPTLQGEWKTFAERMTDKTFQWHPVQKTCGLVVWPALMPAVGKGPRKVLPNTKRKDYERVEVIGYQYLAEINEYTLEIEKVAERAGCG
jgi:hypothetical protein